MTKFPYWKKVKRHIEKTVQDDEFIWWVESLMNAIEDRDKTIIELKLKELQHRNTDNEIVSLLDQVKDLIYKK